MKRKHQHREWDHFHDAKDQFKIKTLSIHCLSHPIYVDDLPIKYQYFHNDFPCDSKDRTRKDQYCRSKFGSGFVVQEQKSFFATVGGYWQGLYSVCSLSLNRIRIDMACVGAKDVSYHWGILDIGCLSTNFKRKGMRHLSKADGVVSADVNFLGVFPALHWSQVVEQLRCYFEPPHSDGKQSSLETSCKLGAGTVH